MSSDLFTTGSAPEHTPPGALWTFRRGRLMDAAENTVAQFSRPHATITTEAGLWHIAKAGSLMKFGLKATPGPLAIRQITFSVHELECETPEATLALTRVRRTGHGRDRIITRKDSGGQQKRNEPIGFIRVHGDGEVRIEFTDAGQAPSTEAIALIALAVDQIDGKDAAAVRI